MQQTQQQSYFQLVNGMPPKSPIMTTSVGNNVKGNMSGATGGVAASQATNMVSQTQMVTSQANNMQQLGGQMQPMQIISPVQVRVLKQSNVSFLTLFLTWRYYFLFNAVLTNGSAFWATASRDGMGHISRNGPANLLSNSERPDIHPRAPAGWRWHDYSSSSAANHRYTDRFGTIALINRLKFHRKLTFFLRHSNPSSDTSSGTRKTQG